MPGILEEVTEGNGPINPLMTVDQVKQEPYNMPAGFEWCSIDVSDPAQVSGRNHHPLEQFNNILATL